MSVQTFRPWLGAAFLLVLLGGLGLTVGGLRLAGGNGEAEVLPTPPPLVRVQPAQASQGYQRPVEFIGRVEARRRSLAGFELDGLVVHMAVDEGQAFGAGEVLAKLDTQRLTARKQELLAQLGEAKAQLDLAKLTRDRTREAEGAKAVSTQQWDEARQGYEVSRKGLDRVKAAIASVDVDIEKSLLRAPYDGVVAARRLDEGQVVRAGEPVLEILETSAPEARIGVSQKYAATLGVGQQHTLLVGGNGGRAVAGRVVSVSPRRDSASRTVDVRFTLNEDLGTVRDGDLAVWAGTLAEDEPGFWLPRVALTENSRGLWSCFVAVPTDGGGHTAELRNLEVLYQGAQGVYVRGTLKDGEMVVTQGRHRLVQGMAVRTAPGGEGS